MALVGVEALNPTSKEKAEELAVQLGVPFLQEQKFSSGVKLVVSDDHVGLAFAEEKRGKPYYVDFLNRSWRARLLAGLPKQHIFRRAFGAKVKGARVVDATAGFGQDSIMALCLEAEVIAVERSPAVVAVLRNGVLRAMREDDSFAARFENLSVVEADSLVFLKQVDKPDIIYIDPMFLKPKSTAKSPKEMQLLQELFVGSTGVNDDESLFELAFSQARDRVVVKRPLKAKALLRTPNHSFKGQSVRYDVYLKG